MFSNIFPLFRIPAVSIITYSSLLYLKTVSTASRVVPATLETINLSLPIKAFTKLLLPTFGLPIKENLILLSFYFS